MIHQETYARASQDKRRNSIATKSVDKVQKIQSQIDALNSNPSSSTSKLTALELRKQSLMPQPSSQEAVEKINAVLNPTVPLNQLTFQYACDECERVFSTSFGLSVHKRVHNKKK